MATLFATLLERTDCKVGRVSSHEAAVFRLFGFRHRATASSNIVFNPFCVRALHSKYLTAQTSIAMTRP